MKILIAFLVLLVLMPNSFAQSQCDYKVEVLANGSEFQANDFNWRMKSAKIEGASTNISGTARITDSSGNIIKSYKPWTNESISKQKTSSEYSPNLKEGEYKIISEIYVECDDTNKNNNIDTKTIKIKSAGKTKNNEIIYVPNNFAPNENNTLARNKTQNQEIIINNVNQSAQNITLVQNKTSASDASDSKEQIDDTESNNIIYSSQNNIQKIDEAIPTANAVKNYPIVYQSSNEKSKNLIVFFLLGLSVLLNVILIWKR